jgi:CheY-like chemotaxis protein
MAERERFTEELKQARDEQAAASRAKTDFLSSMSHELRTPLNSILGFSQLLLNSKRHPLNEKQHKQVMQIHKSGHHLLTLINEVLDLARIESGWISLSMEEAVLLDVVSEAYDTVANIAHEEGISLMPLPLELHEYSVTADFTRLKQVLINLLSNAIKYNSEQGKVEVILKVSDEMVEIGVRDTGIGIPDEYIEDIFEPFNRLDADKTLIEGTGVGLALTKKLVELMEGTIRVESIPKTGTTFWVSLKRASTNKPMHVDNEPADLSFSAVNTRSKLLYIEDNPANQRLMADIMEDYPTIDLTLAHDAVFGIDIAKAEHPDLIILDINLPGMDGIKACKLLKEDPVTASIPIIALSANAMKSDISKGLDAGFDEYLTKPIDVGELLNTLTRYLDNMD